MATAARASPTSRLMALAPAERSMPIILNFTENQPKNGMNISSRFITTAGSTSSGRSAKVSKAD